jgi:hypothetical protein
MMKPDWIVLWASPSVETGGLNVHVKNLNFSEGDPNRYCYWTIDHYSVNDERYNWSRCDWEPGAKERFEALRRRSG